LWIKQGYVNTDFHEPPSLLSPNIYIYIYMCVCVCVCVCVYFTFNIHAVFAELCCRFPWLLSEKLSALFKFFFFRRKLLSTYCSFYSSYTLLSGSYVLTTVSFGIIADTGLSSAFFLHLLTLIHSVSFSIHSSFISFSLPAFMLPYGPPGIFPSQAYHHKFFLDGQPIPVRLV